jgi:hypothetical protein
MPDTIINLPSAEVKVDNPSSFNEVIQQSYSAAKKQIQEGVTIIKEEFVTMYETAGTYLQRMVLPVNNFLKDLTQIDKELQVELIKEKICSGELNCNSLEENY